MSRFKEYYERKVAEDPDYWKKRNRRFAAANKRWCANNPDRLRASKQKSWAKYYKQYNITAECRAARLVASARRRAKAAGIAFDLKKEDVQAVIERGFCEVTGIEFDLRKAGGGGFAFGPSLDKIDPNGGYTWDNVQVVVKCYNTAKGVDSHDEVMILAMALVQEYTEKRRPPKLFLAAG